jgi:riboflavin synthase
MGLVARYSLTRFPTTGGLPPCGQDSGVRAHRKAVGRGIISGFGSARAQQSRVFTGIVQHVGRLAGRIATPAGARLTVDPSGWTHAPCSGDSISVNGCCLTVAHDPRSAQSALHFVVVPQTLSRTTLGGLATGSLLNLEHAATPATLLGGHLVQGHVDGVGVVRSVTTGSDRRVRVSVDNELMGLIAPRGSICVDGVSLTVASASVEEAWFEVALIPTTLERTILSSLREGTRVNVECDAIARHVAHFLDARGLAARGSGSERNP